MELLIGILCGIALSLFFSFGPAFFSLLQNSIHYGFKKATSFAIGVSLSDVAIVFLMLTVLRSLNMSDILHNVWVASFGAIVTGWMGVHTFRRKAQASSDKKSHLKFKSEAELSRRELLLHGFILNFLNPLIWIYWISLITVFASEMGLTTTERYIFFAGLLIGTLGMDITKCRLASLLQQWITARILNIFNKVTGSILIAFAIYLIVSMILYQTNPQMSANEQESMANRTHVIQKIHSIGRDSSRSSATIAVTDSTL